MTRKGKKVEDQFSRVKRKKDKAIEGKIDDNGRNKTVREIKQKYLEKTERLQLFGALVKVLLSY